MIKIEKEIFNSDIQRLMNQIWKLIPMKEEDEDWETHLKIILEELYGLQNIFIDLNFLILLSKLEGLFSPVCDDFIIYRKTVFRCMTILGKLKFKNE